MSVSERLQTGLGQPFLVSRCQEVAHILQEVSNKDGIYVLRSIVESIFGTYEESSVSNIHQQQIGGGGGGWGLRVITFSEHQAEYQAVRAFLSPAGPLLNFIYRLLNEPFQLLPFPVAWLPLKIRNEIQEGTAGPFYLNKIQYLGPGKTPANLLLNSFEYYMFHYGYFLVGNGSIRWNLYWSSIKDSLYPTLLEDYLAAYLPCDATLPPGPSSIPTSPRGVLSPVAQRTSNADQIHPNSQSHNIFSSPILSQVKAFDHHPHFDSPMGNLAGNTGAYQASSALHTASYSEVSIWTSQTLIQILMELWVNLCCPSSHLASPNASPTHGPKIGSHPSVENVFIPDCDHVRAVRMVIKHFHYFSNSWKPNQPSPLDSMRKNIWLVYRKIIYYFIKHLFVHWPLDSSFRLVLETWLSHIQPWRYVTYTLLERDHEGKDVDCHRSVGTKWKTFLAENYLFYSSFFNFLLKRILKLDLSSSKNAQILFRVAKVFSQENLMSMLKDIESSLEMNNPYKSGCGINGVLLSHSNLTISRESMEGQHSPQALAQIIRSHVLEVEKSNYHHIPIFGDDVLKDVFCLIDLARKTSDILKTELTNLEGNSNFVKAKSSSWLSSFFRTLFDSHRTQEIDSPVEEIKRCIFHLDTSVNQFCLFFDVNISDIVPDRCSSPRNTHSFSDNHLGSSERFRVPDQIWTDTGLTLSDYGRLQLLNGLRRIDLKYEGDPDLKPICSFEIGFLVKLLYRLSNFLNTKYESKLTDLYHRRDFGGRLARVILNPPQTVYESVKTEDAQNPHKRVIKSLPPRISLRFLAQKRILLVIVLFYTLLWIGGFSQLRVTFNLLIPLCVTLMCFQAFFQQESLSPEPSDSQ